VSIFTKIEKVWLKKMKHIDGWMTQFRAYYNNKDKKAARMMKSIKRVTF
jgi:hypothetical protein